MSVGEKLKNLRLSAKRTLKQQSDIFGVTLNTVYRWEHDIVKPRKSTLGQIADFYNVKYEWLLKDDDKMKSTDKYGDENTAENQLLKMFRQLPVDKKYKVLGYIEHIFMEYVFPET